DLGGLRGTRAEMWWERCTRREGQIRRARAVLLSRLKVPSGQFLLVLRVEGAPELGLGDFVTFVVFDFNAIGVGIGPGVGVVAVRPAKRTLHLITKSHDEQPHSGHRHKRTARL